MRESQTSNLLTKAEVFGLSGTDDGTTLNKKPLMNSIPHGTHHPVAIHDIFDCTGHMKGGNTNDSKFIRNCMDVIMDELDTRK